MPYLQSGDVRLYAERRGEGSPLLFIAGTGSDLAVRPTGFDLSPVDYVSAFMPILDTRWADPAVNDPLREYLVAALSKRPTPDACFL